MVPTLDALKAQSQNLSPAERVELATILLEGIEAVHDDAIWRAEVARRIAEIRSGSVVGRSVDEVIAELREQPASY